MLNVTLRNIVDDDISFICSNWLNDDRMQVFPKDVEELKNMIKSLQAKTYNGKYFEMFLIIDKLPVGVVSLYEHSNSEVSVGIYIDNLQRHKGYGTAAYDKIIETAKLKGYKFLSAGVRANNIASIRLHEKFGFLKEGFKVNKSGFKQIQYVLNLTN